MDVYFLIIIHYMLMSFSDKLIALCVEARQNFGRFLNFIEVAPPISHKILWNDQRIVNAKNLFESGRISALAFVKWCRTSVRDTIAVVRQGRRLRRYLKAQDRGLEYDEVPTSSDSSVAR